MTNTRALLLTGLAGLTISAAGWSCKAGDAAAGHATTPAQASAKVQLTEQQKQALLYATQGAAYQLKQPDKAVERFRLAAATEPDNREWQDSLAFALWKDNKTKEAVTIWKALATGNDDIAKRAARWLAKSEKAGAAK